jgi:polysaccharide transporter, PST family
MSLSVKAARGGIVMFSGQVLKISLQMLNLVILARLLMPEDFGLVAMVLALFGLCDIFLDLGLSTASIQAAKITKKQISNLFWINVLVATLLALIAFLSASWLAAFYARPELTAIAQVLSVIFLCNGVSAQYKAQLNRGLQFKKLICVDILGSLSGIGVGIFCAYHDFHYWAVVAQLVSQASIQMVMYMLLSKWLPDLPSRNQDMASFFKFGWGLMASQLVTYFSNSIPSILIGRYIGASQLGLFDRANKLLMMPLSQINGSLSTVALPILSKLEVEDRNKYNRFLLFGQNIILHIVAFSLAIANCQTEELVMLILGQQWLDMVSIFKALSYAGAFFVLSYTSYWIFLSKGITTSLLKMSLIGRSSLICITCLGLMAGAEGVAYAYSIGLMVNWIISVYWLRSTGIPAKTMIYSSMITVVCYFSSSNISNYLVEKTITSQFNLLWGWAFMFIILILFYLVITPFKNSVKQVFEIKKYIRNKN